MSCTSSSASAVWFEQPRTAVLRQEAVPNPHGDELLVEAICSLVSAGSEMTVFRGEVASETEVALPTRKGEFPFPISFGYQVVGRVSKTGPEATHDVGDIVLSQHPHQDRFVVSSRFAAPVPAETPPEAAAFANLCGVAVNGHLDVPVRIGDCCVVFGLGIVGRFAAELARRTAGRLILVDPIVERRDASSRIGADAVVAPSELATVIDELTAGRGADVAIEVSGHPQALQQAIDCTGPEGTLVVLSYYGQRPVTLRLSPEFHLRRQRIVSSAVRDLGSGLQPRWDRARRMATAMQLVRTIDTESMISHRIAFEDAPRAYQLLDRDPASTLGVLLEYQ
jgi:2-desacetyl-2-hydroxyethyl bacteriochlorophyllide A dehydrogenase